MNQTMQSRPAPAGVRRTGNTLRVVAGAAAAALAVAAATHLVERPPFVDRVTVVNGSSLELDIDASATRSGEWTPAGVVQPGATATFREVIDHGHTWWIRATAAGQVAVWKVSGADLERGHWRIAVPRAVVDELVSGGATRQ